MGEQHATNTGLIAATPANKDAARVLRTWLKREDPEDKDNTVQGVLTWEIAPKERENGVIIKALTQVQAPNYVTYDFKSHLKKGNARKNNNTWLVSCTPRIVGAWTRKNRSCPECTKSPKCPRKNSANAV